MEFNTFLRQIGITSIGGLIDREISELKRSDPATVRGYFCTLFNLAVLYFKIKVNLELTFHWGALRACSGHHNHPHAGPSAVGKVLWTVLFTHHLHKGATLDVLRRLHGSVQLKLPPLSWSAA